MREKEQETRERCREVPVTVSGLRVPKGAKPGSVLKYVSDQGHSTPGKLPGRAVLKVQHGSPQDLYTIAESDLHTVLKISLEQALYGFTARWNHLGEQKVVITRKRQVHANEVVKFPKKGLVGERGARGDLYVRIAIELPEVKPGTTSMTLQAPKQENIVEPNLSREDSVELREGSAWKRWVEREAPRKSEEKSHNSEL